jgi:hypothetical protein
MKRKALLQQLVLSLLIMMPLTSFGYTPQKETLHYNIMYKWGLINKKAGSVEIKTTPSSSKKEFNALLTGATAKWADRFYVVRDTLRGTINTTTFLPSYYEKIANEGGDYDHDKLVYHRQGNSVTANTTRCHRGKKDTEITCEEIVHESTGLTLDMLSAFYYMRCINYPSMQKGETIQLYVLSGSKKEVLKIHYQGMETVTTNQTEQPTYHITFTFTTEGGKVSSDNMDAWISTDNNRIPVLMEGKLSVGKIRAVYAQ